jgi:hypothetical protein
LNPGRITGCIHCDFYVVFHRLRGRKPKETKTAFLSVFVLDAVDDVIGE